MKNQSRIKERIEKLLQLSNSTNENEAQAALLKAKSLMVEYKIEESDLKVGNEARKEDVISVNTGITFQYGAVRGSYWRMRVADIIAKNTACDTLIYSSGRVKEIMFYGLPQDVTICEYMFKYAINFIEAEVADLRDEIYARGKGETTQGLAAEYGTGFAEGLMVAFLEQQENNSAEWGLVLQVPKVVKDKVSEEATGTTSGASMNVNKTSEHFEEGFRKGSEFNTRQRIE